MLDSIQFDAAATPLRFGPEQGEMRAGHLRGFFEQVHGSGGDPRAILERYGIDPFGFSDPDSYLDCSAAVNMLEFCADRFNDRLFGARLARRQSADVFGAAAALGRAAPTFGEGLLGYSEQSSFGRTCRGWFGVAPRALRRFAMQGRVY